MEKSREQFEAWFAPQKEEMKRNGFGMMHITRMYLRQLSAWQASRESLEIELPPKQEILDDYDMYEIGFNIAVNRLREILISNGVKVK